MEVPSASGASGKRRLREVSKADTVNLARSRASGYKPNDRLPVRMILLDEKDVIAVSPDTG